MEIFHSPSKLLFKHVKKLLWKNVMIINKYYNKLVTLHNQKKIAFFFHVAFKMIIYPHKK
jgi:hypothetical protein